MNFYIGTSALLVAALVAPSNAWDFASNQVHELESLYVEDCTADTKPHGFYGAFLQPCEFTFIKNEKNDDYGTNPCADGTNVGNPVPMHWFFNLTEHMDKHDWDKMSSDDLPDADELMLWPDQCVGVASRCYSVEDMKVDMKDVLSRIFDTIPDDATHVQVDCRGDAMQLSRVIYGFADGFEKGAPTIIAWMVTVVLLFAASTMWCCFGCFSLMCRRRSNNKTNYHYRGPAPATAAYVVLDGNATPPEKEMYA